MVEMRGALLDYMDQHHESHLVQVSASSALRDIRHAKPFCFIFRIDASLFITVISLSIVMLSFTQSGQDQPESRWDLPGWCPTFDFEGVPPIAAADILAHAARARDAGDEGMGRMRCLGSEPINPEDFAAHVESLSPLNSNCCVYTHHVPAREAKLSTSGGESLGINPKVEGMLRANGLDPDGLYSHQASAIAASLSGRDTIVTTSTASGKRRTNRTLCSMLKTLKHCHGDIVEGSRNHPGYCTTPHASTHVPQPRPLGTKPHVCRNRKSNVNSEDGATRLKS